MKTKYLIVALLCVLFFACSNGDGGEASAADRSEYTLISSTTHPDSGVFEQNSTGQDYITFTVSGMDASRADSFKVNYTIESIFSTRTNRDYVVEDSIDFNSKDGASQTKQVSLDKSRPGHFIVRADIENGPAMRLPEIGTRPRDYLNYAVVPNTEGRRMNIVGDPYTAPPGGTEGVDKYLFFGYVISPTSIKPFDNGVVDPVTYLGFDVSQNAELRWTAGVFWDSAKGETDVEKLEFFATRDTKYPGWTEYADNNAPTASSLLGRTYWIADMAAHMPDGVTELPRGHMSGKLNDRGKEEFVKYCEGLAKIHIFKAAHRPLHYYQILWEPMWQWGAQAAFLPAGDAGNRAIVEIYKLGYEAIHRIYNEAAAGTLELANGEKPVADPNWSKRAVVLGPTGSALGQKEMLDWHKDLFALGFAEYIDGISTHPYNAFGTGVFSEDAEDSQFANYVKQMMDDTTAAYEARSTPRYTDKLHFWGTEQGQASGRAETGPVRHAQLVPRHNLIMLGEGFDSNLNFISTDFDSARYGFFYNCSNMAESPWNQYSSRFLAPKQVVPAFAALTWLLKGYKPAAPKSRLDDLPGNSNFGYKFQDTESNDVIYAVWKSNDSFSSAGTETVTLSIDSGAGYTVYNVVGDTVKTGTGTSVELTLSEWVQYVKVTK